MKGDGSVAAGFGGEGSTNRGTFHEGINLAAVKKLPVLFVCENNRKQLWNDISETTAVENIASRAAAYGIPGESVDGNDPLAIYEAAMKLAERARKGEGPGVLECRTFKWRDSGNNIRLDKEDVDQWKAKRDPVLLFKTRLEGMNVLDRTADQGIRSRVLDKLEKAVAYGKNGKDPLPEEAVKDVYSMPVDVQSGGGAI